MNLVLLQGMLTQLRAIFDLIVQFQNTQEGMYHTALDELRARQRLDDLAKQRTQQVRVFLPGPPREGDKGVDCPGARI